MGDIADGLINGDFDFFTGEYIGNGGGHPRTLSKSLSWERGNKKNKKKISSAEYGVMNWLCLHKGYSKEDAYSTIRWYAPEIEIESLEIEAICIEIQKNFQKFAQWFHKNSKH